MNCIRSAPIFKFSAANFRRRSWPKTQAPSREIRKEELMAWFRSLQRRSLTSMMPGFALALLLLSTTVSGWSQATIPQAPGSVVRFPENANTWNQPTSSANMVPNTPMYNNPITSFNSPLNMGPSSNTWNPPIGNIPGPYTRPTQEQTSWYVNNNPSFNN